MHSSTFDILETKDKANAAIMEAKDNLQKGLEETRRKVELGEVKPEMYEEMVERYDEIYKTDTPMGSGTGNLLRKKSGLGRKFRWTRNPWRKPKVLSFMVPLILFIIIGVPVFFGDNGIFSVLFNLGISLGLVAVIYVLMVRNLSDMKEASEYPELFSISRKGIRMAPEEDPRYLELPWSRVKDVSFGVLGNSAVIKIGLDLLEEQTIYLDKEQMAKLKKYWKASRSGPA